MATKKKEPSWDEIGKSIGKKIEKEFKTKENPVFWQKSWMCHHEGGGGFGRLIFIIGVLYALTSMGLITNVPLWQLAIIVIGFTLMKF